MRIQDLPEAERPREKAASYGVSSLNNREVLALLLRTGYRGASALDLADHLLEEFGSIQSILGAEISELSKVKGISKSKALELASIGELAKRAEKEMRYVFRDANSLFTRYKEQGENEQEVVLLLTFDRAKRLIREHNLRIGNSLQSVVSIAEILSRVLKDGAKNFVLLHNHPSGVPLPSKEDIEFSALLSEESARLGLRFLDHLILAKASYFSFHEQELL